MCGIVGVASNAPVNQLIYDALLLLQHRGQDSTGIATCEGRTLHMSKAKGQVREAFRTRDMRALLGNVGLGHVRYATAGAASNEEEAQPFYVNAPYGIILVHNGNLTNTRELTNDLFSIDRRHVNTSSDTELLLNVLATELQGQISGLDLDPDQAFKAVSTLHTRVQGSYAVIAIIAGKGLLAFRDPFGIRPLILGSRIDESTGKIDWVVASESLVLESAGFEIVRDVEPGEAGPVHSAGLLMVDADSWPCADLRADWTDEACPIEAVARAWAVYAPQMAAYVQRARDPREAPSYGVPGVIFDAAAKGAQAYIAFGKELVERLAR